MLRRLLRARVLLLGCTMLAGAAWVWTNGAGGAWAPPTHPARPGSSAPATAAGALVSLLGRTPAAPGGGATPDCPWPSDAETSLLAPRAGGGSGCRQFLGLLVPCTTAKTCMRGKDGKTSCWKTVDDTSLLKELIPSVFSTLSAATAPPRLDLVIYVGYDGGDAIYDTDAARAALPQRIKAALATMTKPGDGGVANLPRIGLQLVRCAGSRSMVSASNCISQQADADGAEYTYRVNDDTVFETAGWLDALPAALQALDPPNVGVVGPQASGGNWKVLTYDAVHRSHLEIFGGHRYPAVFKNWYSDDWISKVCHTHTLSRHRLCYLYLQKSCCQVYEGEDDRTHSRGQPPSPQLARQGVKADYVKGRMVMLSGVTVRHTRSMDHTRYKPDHDGKGQLPLELSKGTSAVQAYLRGEKPLAPPADAAPADGQQSKSVATRTASKQVPTPPPPPPPGGPPSAPKEAKSSSSPAKTLGSDSSIETKKAMAALGDCPDGKWQVQGNKLVCPSNQAGVKASSSEKEEEEDDGLEDAIGAADERLSTRFDPNRAAGAACRLPAGRATALTKQQARLLDGSSWCAEAAGLRRRLPNGSPALVASLHEGAAGLEVRARCATGALRWTTEGHEILSSAFGLGASKQDNSWTAVHGPAWRSLPQDKELVVPFHGSDEADYVEVSCDLPPSSEGGKAAKAWASREVFSRFAPAPQKELAPPVPAVLRGGKVGTDGLNIAVIIVDSLSRAQAMAYLPKLRQLLQDTAPGQDKSHASFVFDHAGVVGSHSGTNSNMGALFAGRKYHFQRDDAERVSTLVSPWRGPQLWDELRALGYVTAASFPFGDLWGASYWNSTFDHLRPALFDMRGYSHDDHDTVLASWTERGEPMCVGSQLSSDIETTWLEGFLTSYSSRKKFFYAHFLEGHHDSVATAQLDENLHKLITTAMQIPNTAVHLASDHGGVPRDLPLSALLLPTSLLKAHPDVLASLSANQHKYVTHYDMRVTLRHLSRWPEPAPAESTMPVAAASLLKTLEGRRDCSVDIGDGHCVCRQDTLCVVGCSKGAERAALGSSAATEEAQVLSASDAEPTAAAKKVAVKRARQAAEKVVADFNRARIQADVGGGRCRRLTVDVLTHVQSQRLPLAPAHDGAAATERALVYVEFTAKESSYSRFHASAVAVDNQEQVSIESSGQLTSYQVFRACADPRLPAPFCVCRDP